MTGLYQKIQETKKFLQSKIKEKPQIGIILGTGLSGFAEEIKSAQKIPYENIPHFSKSTVMTHLGELIFGKIADKKVLAMAGRFHYYEGYSLEEITFPVRIMKSLGAKILIVSNASGGLNPFFKAGDLMLIADHINLMGVNPLIGPNDDRLGPRFPDMFNAYDVELLKLAEEVAIDLKITVKKGVYVAVTGPNLETPAEYLLLGKIADAVGMSTVPEVIVARHCGLKVLGISIITDECSPQKIKPVDIDEIIRIANEAEPKMRRLVKEIIRRI